MTGKVKWFDAKKGFGFITCDDGHPDCFVHWSAIDAKGYRSLAEGEHVEFRVENSPRGPKAQNVRMLGSATNATLPQR